MFRIHQPNRKTLLTAGLFLFSLLMLGLVAMYQWTLSPVDASSDQEVRVVVQKGDGVADIANQLQYSGLIRNTLTFRVYTELTGSKSRLQAGGYAISKSMSVADIVDRMSTGSNDEINIIILPGLTLKQQMDHEVRNSLAWQGFSQDEIRQAFDATYDHPLLAGRPAGASLEGYIYPETYRINTTDPLSVLLEKSFDELYAKLQADGMEAKFQAHGLTLFQAITLASIVQKEVSDPSDQKQVAQVFLKRLNEGMMLGSDVTFFYAAEKLGMKPSVNLDSPYNTRRYVGIPPGPISNMNYSALQAVADPAPGDYLYFVSGDGEDEGKTFFSRTEAEHEANIKAHCHTLCQ